MSKKKRSWKQWLGIGLAVFFGLAIIGAIFGEDTPETTPEATEETATSTAVSEELTTSTSEEPAEEPTTEETTTSEDPTPASSKKQDAMPWLESQFGMTPGEALTMDPTSWYGYVSDAYIESGDLYVRMQVDRKADKELGKQAAKALANFIGFSDDPLVADAGYAIVENGVGEFIAQERVK